MSARQSGLKRTLRTVPALSQWRFLVMDIDCEAVAIANGIRESGMHIWSMSDSIEECFLSELLRMQMNRIRELI